MTREHEGHINKLTLLGFTFVFESTKSSFALIKVPVTFFEGVSNYLYCRNNGVDQEIEF